MAATAVSSPCYRQRNPLYAVSTSSALADSSSLSRSRPNARPGPFRFEDGATRRVVASSAALPPTQQGGLPGTSRDAPGNSPTSAQESWRAASEARRSLALEEYRELKLELNKITGAITALGSAYCFLGFSLETALSFAFGCIFSVAYLQELVKAVDKASKDNVPAVFQGRLPRRRSSAANLVSTAKLAGSLERFLEGSKMALFSPRLLLPGMLVLAWAASRQAAGGDPASTHLELAPLLLGFFTYKAAVLVITFRESLDML